MIPNEPFLVGLLVWYSGWSLVAFLVFAWDKHAARHGRRRVPEARLHALELVGGFPGAWCAILLLRHKSAKVAFLVLTTCTTLLNLAGLVFLLAAVSHLAG